MCTVTYDVSYRRKGDTGFSRTAIVVVADSSDSRQEVITTLANSLGYPPDTFTNVYPVRIRAGSIIQTRG